MGPDDLITSDLVRRTYVGETFLATYNEKHKWYYLAEQEPDEVSLFKIHDPSEKVVAKGKLKVSHSYLSPSSIATDKDSLLTYKLHDW